MSMDVFARWAQGTAGLRQPFPVISEAVVKDAFPSDLIPGNFDGKSLALTFLDSTASTQQSEVARRVIGATPYANTHAHTYANARITTKAYEAAHGIVLGFVRADPSTHKTVFLGSGATAAANRVARSLFLKRNEGDPRDTVIFTGAEHHANILPWRQHARAFGVNIDPERGTPDLNQMEALLKEHQGRVRLVAATGMSNVTGAFNPMNEIARLAHQYGAQVLEDAAQELVHRRPNMKKNEIDFLMASGHKAYVRRSPGILVMPHADCPDIPDELGGGIVEVVRMDGVVFSKDREEAGTPNPLGAIGLAANLMALQRVGMRHVYNHEQQLTRRLVHGLIDIAGITVYGDNDLDRTPRGGVVTFNITGLHHEIVGQALADYFNIATRNGCFCAHPLVNALLGMSDEDQRRYEGEIAAGNRCEIPGMVRASLGVYTSQEDVDRLIYAVKWIALNADKIRSEYWIDQEGHAIRYDGWHLDLTNYDPYRIVLEMFPEDNGDDESD